jgi:hypothetical protein
MDPVMNTTKLTGATQNSFPEHIQKQCFQSRFS